MGTGGERTDVERQEFSDAQQRAFENTQGDFFWSYKIESGNPAWSLRDAVDNGLHL
jgi:hypothetical protein